MQTFNLTVGQVKNINAVPKDAAGYPAICTGVAQTTNVDDAIAKKTNNSGDGLSLEISALSPGSTIFTSTGHQADGTTPFATSFQVNVLAGDPTHFDFVLV